MLEIEIITANGDLLTANNCTNTDLFWALKGGGGGSWGVIVKVIYKVHER